VLYEVTVLSPNSVVLYTRETFYLFDTFRFNTESNVSVAGRNDAGVGGIGSSSMYIGGVIGIGVPQGKLYNHMYTSIVFY